MALKLKSLGKGGDGSNTVDPAEIELAQLESKAEQSAAAAVTDSAAPIAAKPADNSAEKPLAGPEPKPVVLAQEHALDEEALEASDSEEIPVDLNDILAAVTRAGNEAVSAAAAAKEATVAAAAATQAVSQQGQVTRPALGGAEAVAHVVGTTVGGAVAMPFMALSAAAKHFTSKVKSARATSSLAPSIASVPGSSAMAGVLSAELFNTAEMLTGEKCDRIEKAARDVCSKAGALRSTPEYAVFDEVLAEHELSTGKDRRILLKEIQDSPELASLKNAANMVWGKNSDLVNEYRDRCDAFVRAIRTSEKKYASRNTEPETRERVNDAMTMVANQTEGMPGFGDELGRFVAPMADRVMELVRRLAEVFSNLHAKVFGTPLQERRASSRNDFDM